MKLRNKSNYAFSDISSETKRVYDFGNGKIVEISNPYYLSVSQNGHRILDNEGISHYIPNGWIHLKWETKQGCPHFVR